MILIYLFMVYTIASMNCMEQGIDTRTYTLPFYNDIKCMPINSVDEIVTLAEKCGSEPLYRQEPESNEGQPQLVSNNSFSKGKNNDAKLNNDKKNNDENIIIGPNLTIPLGTMPFKPSVYCGIGYLSLIAVVLDLHFKYHTVLDQHQKKNKFIKICELNNAANMYYIITMLNQVSGEYINNCVLRLRADHVVPILCKRNITSSTYSDKNASTYIDTKDANAFIEFVKDIDQLIPNERYKGPCVYAPLKQHQADYLLQLLLQIYILWDQNNVIEIKEPLVNDIKEYMTLFLETTQVQNNVKNYEEKNYENMLAIVTMFIEQVKSIHMNKNFDIAYQKCFIFNNFLYALNQYVYNLIVVPVSNVKSNRALDNQSSAGKRKKNINSDSFFVRYAQIIGNAKKATLIIVLIGLLYRVVKKNNKHRKI